MKLENHIDSLLRKLFGFTKSTNISIEDLKRVDVLSLENLPIKTIDDVVNMPNLHALNISGTGVQDISALSKCMELEKLAFYDCNIEDLTVLPKLQNLKELYMNNLLNEETTLYISKLKELELLDIHLKTKKLDFLLELANIKYLRITSKHITLTGIEQLSNLEYLELDAKTVDHWELLKSLPQLKEVVFLNVSNQEKTLLSQCEIEVNEVSNLHFFSPIFVSDLSRFVLDSRLKQDALDMFKAFSILSLVFLIIIYGILIFDKETGGFWNGTFLALGLFVFLSSISLWMYSMHFEMEFGDDFVYITRLFRKHRIAYSHIELVQIKLRSMIQSKIKLKTTDQTYRLTSSVFLSYKSLGMMVNEFENHGIETETIRKS